MIHPLAELLDSRIVIGDGAMGTSLYSAGVPFDGCFDEVNLSNAELVGSIHRGFIDAGADIVETNSYGANRFKLEHFGLGDRVKVVNKAAARIAREQREISGRPVIVAGSIGPTGVTLEPIGKVKPHLVRDAFREQIEALLEGGVDVLTIETIPSVPEMRLALEAAKACSDLPIIAMMTFAEDGKTVGGDDAGDSAKYLMGAEVAGAGANCSVGPQRLLKVMKRFATEREESGSRTAIVCQPNAGWPAQVAGRVIYPSSPEYFASFAQSASELGVNIIGGCCGTTPEHIRAMADAVTGVSAKRSDAPVAPRPVIRTVSPIDRATKVERDSKGSFRKALASNFVVSVEIDPPKGLNQEKALAGARLLKRAGVDAINVADSPMARVRMSALTLCYLIRSQVDVETIVHFTTRDRSLMGIQSELLGAHAAGVRTILALTGDPPTLGAYPGTTGVFDIDSLGLIRLLCQMNSGVDATGSSIGVEADFLIGCAVDPTRSDLGLEAERLHAKLEAGAHFVMTQPIYGVEVWHAFLEAFGGEVPAPLLIGILPLQSTKHAEFLHNEVPGITLTDDARARMKAAGADGRSEGVAMAQELLLELKPHAQGVYLMPSFGRYEVAAQVLDVLQGDEGRPA